VDIEGSYWRWFFALSSAKAVPDRGNGCLAALLQD
jgi:hypothetical protein